MLHVYKGQSSRAVLRRNAMTSGTGVPGCEGDRQVC